jgi:hypothetical protein
MKYLLIILLFPFYLFAQKTQCNEVVSTTYDKFTKLSETYATIKFYNNDYRLTIDMIGEESGYIYFSLSLHEIVRDEKTGELSVSVKEKSRRLGQNISLYFLFEDGESIQLNEETFGIGLQTADRNWVKPIDKNGYGIYKKIITTKVTDIRFWQNGNHDFTLSQQQQLHLISIIKCMTN